MLYKLRNTLCLLTIISTVFISDYFSKLWIINNVSYASGFKVNSFFSIVHVKNLGVSFSLFYNHHALGPYILATLVFCIIVMLLYFMYKTPNFLSRSYLALVLGGALGNLYDRIVYKGVIDFLDFHLFGYHWPAFNVADCAVVSGVFLYAIFNFQSEKKYDK